MELTLSKASVKFLEKLSPKEAEKLQEKLAYLLQSLETEGTIPFNDLDIKSLKGDWKGFFRMRVAKIRVIFTIDLESEELQVYDIDFRGNIYKSLVLDSTRLSLKVVETAIAPSISSIRSRLKLIHQPSAHLAMIHLSTATKRLFQHCNF